MVGALVVFFYFYSQTNEELQARSLNFNENGAQTALSIQEIKGKYKLTDGIRCKYYESFELKNYISHNIRSGFLYISRRIPPWLTNSISESWIIVLELKIWLVSVLMVSIMEFGFAFTLLYGVLRVS